MLRVVLSSSASARIGAADDVLSSLGRCAEAVLVGATREAVDDLVRGASVRHGATFGWHRFSLPQLAARLAAVPLSRLGLAPATALGAEAATARAVFELLAEGRLPHVEGIGKSPGLSPALAATLRELRLAGLPAEALAVLPGEAGKGLGLLAQRFAERLADARVADRASIFELAVEALAAAPSIVSGRPLLLLDVPVLDASSERLVAALAGVASSVLATCPAGDDRTLAAFVRLSADVVREEPAAATSLDRVRTGLFQAASAEVAPSDGSVVFFSAPGEGRECVEIARFALLEAARGIPFDRMAVLLRSPETHGPYLASALSRARVPAWFTRGIKRPDPSGRAFLALLSCALEGLSARRFAEYLSLGQVPSADVDGAPPAREVFVPADDELLRAVTEGELPLEVEPEVEPDPDGPVVDGALRAPWRWEELLVEAAVIGGRDRWARRLKGLGEELSVKRAEIASEEPDSPRLLSLARDLENLEHLSRFALPVIDLLAAFPPVASWSEWLTSLTGLAPRVLKRPERVLAVLGELAPMEAITDVGLSEVLRVLLPRLTTLEVAPPASRYGRVLVATLEEARGRDVDVVFVPGLAERVFPRRPEEDPMLLDASRRALSEALPTQEDRAHAERLLLRLGVGAARQRLYVSYPRLDSLEARARVTSFYGLDLVRALTGRIPEVEAMARDAAAVTRAQLGWPAPEDRETALDDFEYDLAVLGRLLGKGGGERPESVTGRARYVLSLNPHVARSLRSRYARWRPSFSPYDGLVRTSDLTSALLAESRLDTRAYSVSALQRFAACPYRFLLSAIHRLEVREEIAAAERLDPLTRGSVVHSMLAELMRALSRERLLPITDANLQRARDVLHETVTRVAGELREKLFPAIERVWDDEIAGIRADLLVLLAPSLHHGGFVPERFELGFGLPRDKDRDEASVKEPATIFGKYRLRGSIDLVERTPGPPPVSRRVTDYKTGADRTKAGLVVGGGEVLQPVLYSLAVEALTGEAVPEARLLFCTAKGGYGERRVPLDAWSRGVAERTLETIDEAIGAGFLAPAPREGACLACDFREVCGPNEELRLARKSKDAPLFKALAYLRSQP